MAATPRLAWLQTKGRWTGSRPIVPQLLLLLIYWRSTANEAVIADDADIENDADAVDNNDDANTKADNDDDADITGDDVVVLALKWSLGPMDDGLECY